MATATYWQRGEALDYVNNTEAIIEANTVIVYGDRIAVTGCDIAPGELGSIHVEGVFAFG
jgi:predicted RecA/RadA family phage recombinase